MHKKNTVLITLALLFNFSLPLLTFPFLVRAFDVTTYGIWIEANTFISFLSIFGTQGIANAVGMLLVRDKDDGHRIYVNALYTFILLGTFLAFLLFLSAPLLTSLTIRKPIGTTLIQVIAPQVLLYSLNALGFQLLRLRERTLSGAALEIILGLIRLLAAIVALATQDLLFFAAVFTLLHGLATVIQLSFAAYGLKLTRPSIPMIRQLLSYGANLSVVSQANWIVMYGDRLLLSLLATSAAVAVYAASYQLTLILVALGWPYLYALLPYMAERWKHQDMEGIQAAIRRSTRMMFIVLIPGVVGLTLIGDSLLRLLANDDFAQGGLLIGMIAAGIALDVVGTSLQYIFYTKDMPHVLRRIYTRAMILNIVLNLVAIPVFSYHGAGFTTLFTFMLIFYTLWKRTELPFRSLFDTVTFWKCLLAGMVMAIWVVLTVNSTLIGLVIAIAGGAVIYGVGILLLRVITLDQVLAIPRAILRRLVPQQ